MTDQNIPYPAPEPDELVYLPSTLREISDNLSLIASNPNIATVRWRQKYPTEQMQKEKEQKEDFITKEIDPVLKTALCKAAGIIGEAPYLSQKGINDIIYEQINNHTLEYALDAARAPIIKKLATYIRGRNDEWNKYISDNLDRFLMQSLNMSDQQMHAVSIQAVMHHASLEKAVKPLALELEHHTGIAYAKALENGDITLEKVAPATQQTFKRSDFNRNEAPSPKAEPTYGPAGHKSRLTPGADEKPASTWARRAPKTGPGRKTEEGNGPFGRGH